jgi:1,4-dihydroxy-6-naphthoate synthase
VSALRLGISTCPNDTFTFHGLLTDRVDRRGLELTIELADVEELNRRVLAGDMDVAKVSFHAALLRADEVAVLPTGSALGFGVGPVLLAAPPGAARPSGRPLRVLAPGEHTTAALLYRLFHDEALEHVVFSDIMPALTSGAADLGVCIHEGRFTYQEHGLELVEDLGETWERATSAPLPLGGIVGRKRLGEEVLQRVQAVIRDSLDYGLAHRRETLESMRAHAQEASDDVLFAHVDLYVNEWTRDLGAEGRRALAALSEQAAAARIVPHGRSLTVVEP